MKDLWPTLHKYLDKLSVPGNGNNFRRYGFVIALISIFVVIKATLSVFIGKDVPFLFALFIVILSAWFGGFGPGVVATILTGLITYIFFLEPKFTLIGIANIPNLFILLIFFLEGFFISLLSNSHRRSDIQKSEFIGVISHELKNPLTSIKGYTELIQRKAIKTKDKKIALITERIDAQIRNVIDMINDMLDITKIETGRLTYQDEKFSVMDLVKDIVSDQQVTSLTHRITLTGKTTKYIYGDRYRIGQVITNLISNAIKYSPNAKKVIVHIENKSKSVIVSMRDSGPGIAKEDQQNLFKPFFRAKNTQSAKGTGIGLFISSQIVERHNGKLWVKSTVGKGSTFYLQLYTL